MQLLRRHFLSSIRSTRAALVLACWLPILTGYLLFGQAVPVHGAALAALVAMLAISGALAWRIGTATTTASASQQDRVDLQALLANVYASAPVGLAFLDRDLRIVMVNDYLAAVNGMDAAAHVGHTLPELFGARGVAIEEPYRKVLASGQALVEVQDSGDSPAGPGVMRHWLCSYYPVFDTESGLAGVNGVVQDISERMQHEQRHRDNEVLYRALFDDAHDAHVLIAMNAGFVGANAAAVRLFGCTASADFLAMSPASASPELQPDGSRSDDLAHRYMRQALDEGASQFTWLHRRRDGSLFHADVLLNRVDIGGKGIVHGTIRDISVRFETAAALQAAGKRLEESERMIRAITDHLPALVGYWDAGLRCRFANRPYLDWLGKDLDQVIGRTVDELVDAEQIAQVRPHLDAVLRGEAQFFERTLARKDADKVIQAWGSYIPDLDGAGRVRGFYMLHADITELKRTQSRLEDALHAAQAASSAKSAFLANMSHEIRTPMHAIMGLARLLGEADIGARERGYVARIKMASNTLLSMLGDVLDYSKVDAGRLVLEQTAFRIDTVLASITVLTATGAWQRGIEPVFAVDPDVPHQLTGDPMRLEQVLLNLMSNAVKFTEQGEVVLAIGVQQRDAARVALRFSVRDTGIGIAPAQQERMFDAFSQADSSTSRKYGGTGLGLAISRRLVALMGGELAVDSAPGQGARFSFTAWFGAPALPGTPALAPLAQLRALVVDDNASSRAALAAALRAHGWRVDCAAGANAALALLRGDAGNEKDKDKNKDNNARGSYQLALVDSAMPDLDGASLIAYARADHAVVMPRCVLLAADPEHERMEALAADLRVDAVLAKPFTPQALYDCIAPLVGGIAPAPAAARHHAPLRGRLAGMRVLLVEDNLLNRKVASYMLLHAGTAVDFAVNGRAAIDMLEAGARYDAVLMDLQMPVMDGVEAAAAIRALGLHTLPIVAMTANAMDEDRERALAAGMNDYVAKPIDVDELVATLVGATGWAEQPLPEVANVATVVTVAAPPALPGIDLHATLPRFGGSFSRFAALFKRFEDSQGGALAGVRARLALGDRRGATQVLHRLRGVAANLGATEVASLALAAETAMTAHHDAADNQAASMEAALAPLDAAMAHVFALARRLDLPPKSLPATPPASCDLHDALAQLLDLLQNNNMKAIAQFETLRPTLSHAAPARCRPLADAIATLRFDTAAGLVRAMMDNKEDA